MTLYHDLLGEQAGFTVLNPQGELWTYEANGEMVLDEALSRYFADYSEPLLATYRANPESPGLRLALIFAAAATRQWGAVTMFLAPDVVRELYAVGGAPSSGFTNFQRKNAEKSVYRGMELLLEYRRETARAVPVFCPVVFDRGTTVSEYARWVQAPQEADRDKAVLEVLNLIALVPPSTRTVPEIQAHMRDMHAKLVRKDIRKQPALAVMDEAFVSPREQKAENDPYIDNARELNENLTSKANPLARAGTSPAQFLDPAALRFFTAFQSADLNKLAEIARKYPERQLPAGKLVLARGSNDDFCFFLIEGKLELEAADGERKIVEGGSGAAKTPICHLKPRKYAARSLTPIRYLWIENAVVAEIAGAARGDKPLGGAYSIDIDR